MEFLSERKELVDNMAWRIFCVEPCAKNRGPNLRSQLSDCSPAITLSQSVPILPGRSSELRAPHDDLAEGDTALRLDGFNFHVNPCVEAEDKRGIFSIQYEVATRHEDFAWC